MATITIRNVDPSLEKRLRTRARARGRSVEEEARLILSEALEPELPSLADLALALFGEHGAELEPHPRVPARKPAPIES